MEPLGQKIRLTSPSLHDPSLTFAAQATARSLDETSLPNKREKYCEGQPLGIPRDKLSISFQERFQDDGSSLTRIFQHNKFEESFGKEAYLILDATCVFWSLSFSTTEVEGFESAFDL